MDKLSEILSTTQQWVTGSQLVYAGRPLCPGGPAVRPCMSGAMQTNGLLQNVPPVSTQKLHLGEENERQVPKSSESKALRLHERAALSVTSGQSWGRVCVWRGQNLHWKPPKGPLADGRMNNVSATLAWDSFLVPGQ